MNIGKVISEVRALRGMSQSELAARLSMAGAEVSNQAVSKWEKNQTMPSAKQLLILCAVLGIEDVLGEFTNGRFGCWAGVNDEGGRK